MAKCNCIFKENNFFGYKNVLDEELVYIRVCVRRVCGGGGGRGGVFLGAYSI